MASTPTNPYMGFRESNPWLGNLLTGAGYALTGLAGNTPASWAYAQQGIQNSNQQRLDNRRQTAQDQQNAQIFQEQEADRTKAAVQEQAQQQHLDQIRSGLNPQQQQMFDLDPHTFAQNYIQQQFPKPEQKPSIVQEYEYAKQQGFNGSIFDYQKQKAEAGRSPVQSPQPPADVQEYQFAVGQGFKGSYMDYMASKKGNGFSVTTPDGTQVQMGGAVKPPTESQLTAANRSVLLQNGMDQLEKLYDNPDLSPMRMATAETLEGMGPYGRVAGSAIRTDPEQTYAAAQASALEGLAAAVTGAGVTKDQFGRYTSMLPSYQDKPETRKAKFKAANEFLNTTLTNAGAAGQSVLKNRMQGAPLPNGATQKAVGPGGAELYLFTGQDGRQYWGDSSGKPAQ